MYSRFSCCVIFFFNFLLLLIYFIAKFLAPSELELKKRSP